MSPPASQDHWEAFCPHSVTSWDGAEEVTHPYGNLIPPPVKKALLSLVSFASHPLAGLDMHSGDQGGDGETGSGERRAGAGPESRTQSSSCSGGFQHVLTAPVSALRPQGRPPRAAGREGDPGKVPERSGEGTLTLPPAHKAHGYYNSYSADERSGPREVPRSKNPQTAEQGSERGSVPWCK